MGRVIGSTNRLGEVPQDRPMHYQDVFTTLCHQLGSLGTAVAFDVAQQKRGPVHLRQPRQFVVEDRLQFAQRGRGLR